MILAHVHLHVRHRLKSTLQPFGCDVHHRVPNRPVFLKGKLASEPELEHVTGIPANSSFQLHVKSVPPKPQADHQQFSHSAAMCTIGHLKELYSKAWRMQLARRYLNTPRLFSSGPRMFSTGPSAGQHWSLMSPSAEQGCPPPRLQ